MGIGWKACPTLPWAVLRDRDDPYGMVVPQVRLCEQG